KPVFHTPTHSAAKFLEGMVAQQSPSSSSSASSSSNSRHSSRRTNDNAPIPPLPLYPPTPPPRGDDVRPHREKSSKSRASKNTSKSLPRRFLEDLEGMDYRKSSKSINGNGLSPADSLPGREESYRSHHRHYGRSRSSSDSFVNMLAITTERLSHETIRANEAEKQAAETHEENIRMEKDLRRAQTELGLYKIQLDVAQKEIFKAQEIVDKLERQRAAAEEEAARSRDKVHKLSEARAVEHAMQEARWLGFEEGLKQGRQDVDRQPSHRSRRSEDVSRYSYPYEDVVKSPSTIKLSARHLSSKSYSEYSVRSTEIAPRAAPSTQTRQRHSFSAAPPPVQRTPDVGTYSQLLPRPTITTPMPVEVPSTQPQPAPAMPPQQPPNPIHDHSKHPETINVQDPNAPIHPVSIRNMTPSIRHERIVLPPDNYIPTMGPDSLITLPPPHELSQPVAPEAPPILPPTAPVAPVQQQHPSRPLLLDQERVMLQHGNASGLPAVASPIPGGSSVYSANSGRDQSPTQRIAEEWRSKNREYLKSGSRLQGEPVIPRPPSSASGRRSRRPREIVLPAPLAEVMINMPAYPYRTTSSNTIPGIEVVTPRHARHPLPPSEDHDQFDAGLGLYQNPNYNNLGSDGEERYRWVRPLSPINGMNVNPYPPGFAPGLPKEYPGAMSPHFTYPLRPSS
ncbi:hypothetical protein CPB84DRAFT_1799127, partial [Gymnopilus junonius]